MVKQNKPPLKIKGFKILHAKAKKPNVIRWSQRHDPNSFSVAVNPAEITRLNRIYRPFGKWAIDPALICELDMKACGVVK